MFACVSCVCEDFYDFRCICLSSTSNVNAPVGRRGASIGHNPPDLEKRLGKPKGGSKPTGSIPKAKGHGDSVANHRGGVVVKPGWGKIILRIRGMV